MSLFKVWPLAVLLILGVAIYFFVDRLTGLDGPSSTLFIIAALMANGMLDLSSIDKDSREEIERVRRLNRIQGAVVILLVILGILRLTFI
jgi:hypothetical protein